MFGLLITCTDWGGRGRCSSNTTCHISQPRQLHYWERFTLIMKSLACLLLSNKNTDSYGTYCMHLTLHFWLFGGRLVLGWEIEDEKKTRQRYEMNARGAEGREGEIGSERTTRLWLTPTVWHNRLVELTSSIWQNQNRNTELTALFFTPPPNRNTAWL